MKNEHRPAIDTSPLSPTLLPGSCYGMDEGNPSSLFHQTCREQIGRLHTLDLLSAYLTAGAGSRKREAVAQEVMAMREIYEAVWCELGFAFSSAIVTQAREAVELLVEEAAHVKPT
jgi:hypothetical protein